MANLLLPEHIRKDIPGFEGSYYATTDGKIFSYDKQWMCGTTGKSLVTRKGRQHKPHKSRGGYLRINFRKNKKIKHYLAHVIIAKTFIPNPENKPEVNHLDGDKNNIAYTNLAWATKSENMQHAFDTGIKKSMKGERHGRSKLTEAQVLEILRSCEPQTKLSKMYGVSDGMISLIKNNINWKHLKK